MHLVFHATLDVLERILNVSAACLQSAYPQAWCVQAWKYQPWVQKAIDKRLAKLADVAQPTIGFHVRGGDKLAEDKMLVCASCIKLLCYGPGMLTDILGQKHTTSSCRGDAWHAKSCFKID